MNDIKVEIKENKLVIELPLQRPQPGASGKTLLVASTHGSIATTATVDEKPVTVSVNAYIRK